MEMMSVIKIIDQFSNIDYCPRPFISHVCFLFVFSRKKGLLICHVFGFVSAILFGFCQMALSLEMLIIARFIVGFGCGEYIFFIFLPK